MIIQSESYLFIRRLLKICAVVLVSSIFGVDQIGSAGEKSTYWLEQSMIESDATKSREQQVKQLEAAKPVEREIVGGERHSYRVMMETGQFLRLIVEQKGVDVTIALSKPSGEKIVDVNAEDGFLGVEQLLFLSEAKGNYRLDVWSVGNGVKAGRYGIKVEEMRKANAQDEERVQCQRFYLEGTKLQSQGTAKSLREAVEQYQKSLAGWNALDEPRARAATLTKLGNVYYLVGETKRGLECFTEELPLREAIGDSFGKATVLNNIGFVYNSLGDRQKALEYFNQALPIRREIGDRNGEAITLGNIGLVYNSLGDKQKALQYYNQSLEIFKNVGDRRRQATILGNIGLIYYSLGDKQKALEYHNKALPLFQNIVYPIGEATVLTGLAKIEFDRGNIDQARIHIESVISIVESLRTKTASHDLRSSYFASVRQYYEFYINLLMSLDQLHPNQGFDRKALETSERARARSLLDTLIEARADIRQGVDSTLLDRERSLLQLLNDKNERLVRLLSRKHSEEQAQEARAEIDKLATEFQQVQAEIRTKSPHYAALTQPQPMNAQEIQTQVVDDDTLLLEYSLGDERSFLWAVSSTAVSSFELPKRSIIQASAERVHELLTARLKRVNNETPAQRTARIARADAEYPAAASALSQMLLGPVASLLETKRLVIVGEGPLQYISFAALPKPLENRSSRRSKSVMRSGPLLVQDHEIIILPSASSLAVLRRELDGRPLASRMVAVLADPVFEPTDLRVKRNSNANEKQPSGTTRPDGDQSQYHLTRSLEDIDMVQDGQLSIPRLAYSQREAEVIKRLVPDSLRRVATGFEVDFATATNPELANYRILHLATHSLLNSKQPELSGVLLSLVDEQGRQQERGILSLAEIYNLKLPAELVVLSACRTALGKEVKGEGLIGLTRGFMYAGAARVVASLWKADDEATAELMRLFYEGMLGKQRLKPAAALRRAQVEMMRTRSDWRAPFYWAAFTLQGEWR